VKKEREKKKQQRKKSERAEKESRKKGSPYQADYFSLAPLRCSLILLQFSSRRYYYADIFIVYCHSDAEHYAIMLFSWLIYLSCLFLHSSFASLTLIRFIIEPLSPLFTYALCQFHCLSCFQLSVYIFFFWIVFPPLSPSLLR